MWREKINGSETGGEVGLEWWEEAKYYLSLLFYLAVIHGMDPWNGSMEWITGGKMSNSAKR